MCWKKRSAPSCFCGNECGPNTTNGIFGALRQAAAEVLGPADASGAKAASADEIEAVDAVTALATGSGAKAASADEFEAVDALTAIASGSGGSSIVAHTSHTNYHINALLHDVHVRFMVLHGAMKCKSMFYIVERTLHYTFINIYNPIIWPR